MRPMITDGIQQAVSDTLARVSSGDDIAYEVFMVITPGPEYMEPSIAVLLALPGLAVDEYISAAIVFGNPLPKNADVDRQVQETITQMRAKKAELAQRASNGSLPDTKDHGCTA